MGSGVVGLSTTLTVFDGAESIGGNKIYLESGGKGIFLDFGINFRRMSQFYEEYLKPRSVRGIHDYLELGLIPKLDIYDESLITSDIDRSGLQGLEVHGVLLSHAHVDHSGCLGLLRREIPVYCSAMTAAILKAYQDSGRVELHAQAVYSSQREALDDPRVLKGLTKAGYIGRDFNLTTPCSEEFEDFWGRSPAQKELKAGKLGKPGSWEPPLPFECFEVGHSIYGASAYAVETEDGWVVYTGDFRTHGARGKETERFAEEVSKLDPKVLVIEGTGAGRKEARWETEEEVHENCMSAVSGESGLVIADFSPRHIERLETFARIATETGRRLVVTSKDAYMLDAVRAVDGVDRMKDLLIYKDLKEKRDAWERRVYAGFEEKLVDPEEVSKNPESYVLCFSFWDVKNLLDIKPEGGTYVYSSSEAFTEEAVFDFRRLSEWLNFFGLKIVGFGFDDEGELVFGRGYHASGHASPEELLRMVEEIDPEMVIPVHTENARFFERNLDRFEVHTVKNGEKIEIG
jgi:ribonuclease J